MILAWSEEFEFSSTEIEQHAPTGAGVYQILQSPEYSRYQGTTRVLKIGMSKGDLRSELLNHLGRHTASNRLARILSVPGIRVTFRCKPVSIEAATELEGTLLREFEETHWDVPVLNSQRGFKRGEDRHFRGH